jgi:ATP-dependent Lon protease
MRFPVVPLRDIVFFPRTTNSLLMGRERSIHAVEHAAVTDGRLMLVVQRDPADENPALAELYQMGVVATLLQSTKAANGNMLTWVQGDDRATILNLISNDKFNEAEIAPVSADRAGGDDIRVLAREVREQFVPYAKAKLPTRFAMLVPLADDDPASIADIIASFLPIEIGEKQELLETINLTRRLEKISEILMRRAAA